MDWNTRWNVYYIVRILCVKRRKQCCDETGDGTREGLKCHAYWYPISSVVCHAMYNNMAGESVCTYARMYVHSNSELVNITVEMFIAHCLNPDSIRWVIPRNKYVCSLNARALSWHSFVNNEIITDHLEYLIGWSDLFYDVGYILPCGVTLISHELIQ